MAKEYTFRVGDPVWGKVKGFSAWPGKIILPPDGLKVGVGDMPLGHGTGLFTRLPLIVKIMTSTLFCFNL